MKNTRCPDCKVKLRKELTNAAIIQNIPVEEIADHPGCLDTVWTGRMICPKCKVIIKETHK